MRKKLAMKIDELSIESFETGAALSREGTVFGHETSVGERICGCDTYEQTCIGNNTCAVGCGTGGSGGSGTAGCTYEDTCATGSQRLCGCW